MGRTHSIVWNMTRRCNFRCHYCYFDPLSGRGEKLLNIDDLVDFLDVSGHSFSVGMTGGEPMVHPGFMEACAKLTENHRIGVDTNLSLVPVVRRFAEEIDPAKVDELYVALHIEERQRRDAVGEFIENYHLLKEAGFAVWVNYVLHPSLVERFARDRDYFASHGVKVKARPFKGWYQGVDYPAGYDPRAKELLAAKRGTGKKMVFNFLGVPCEAGRSFVRVDPDGSVYRCSGDLTKLGVIGQGVHLYDQPQPCTVRRCPCFGAQNVHLDQAQENFFAGLARYVEGAMDEAAGDFKSALAMDPKASNALNNLGAVAWQRGAEDEASGYFARAVAMHPGNKLYVLNAAGSLAQAGQWEPARKICARFLARHQDQEVMRLAGALDIGRAVVFSPRLCVDLIPADNPAGIWDR